MSMHVNLIFGGGGGGAAYAEEVSQRPQWDVGSTRPRSQLPCATRRATQCSTSPYHWRRGLRSPRDSPLRRMKRMQSVTLRAKLAKPFIFITLVLFCLISRTFSHLYFKYPHVQSSWRLWLYPWDWTLPQLGSADSAQLLLTLLDNPIFGSGRIFTTHARLCFSCSAVSLFVWLCSRWSLREGGGLGFVLITATQLSE